MNGSGAGTEESHKDILWVDSARTPLPWLLSISGWYLG